MDKRRLLILVILLVVIVGGFGWFLYQQRNGNELAASGTIEATEVTISSKVVAKVLEVKVDEGSKVNQADVLAVLDDSELKENMNAAQAKYQMAKDDYERSKQLFADKMISPQQFDASASALEVAKSLLASANLQVDNTVIKAPISGVILVRAIEPGELATIGTPIVTMADLSKVKLTVYLGEQNIGKIQLGEEVSVSVDAYQGKKFTGRIAYISDQAEFTPKSIQTKEERVTQVFAVKIDILNPELQLKPGMPADAEFSVGSGK